MTALDGGEVVMQFAISTDLAHFFKGTTQAGGPSLRLNGVAAG